MRLATVTVARPETAEPRAQHPLGVLPDANLRAPLDYPHQVFNAIGLPTLGLTEDDATDVLPARVSGRH